MSDLEHIGRIFPRVLAHIWTGSFEYGNHIHRCPCGLIQREYDGKTEWWRWEHGELVRLRAPPPHRDVA